ncbi:MAG: hypothetical protein AB1650_07375 [Candidatus Omnitrophota bacterium]
MSEENSSQAHQDNQKAEQPNEQKPEGLRKILNSFDEKPGDSGPDESGAQPPKEEDSPEELPLPPLKEETPQAEAVSETTAPEIKEQHEKTGSSDELSPAIPPDSREGDASRIDPEQIISEAMKKLDKLLEEIKKNEFKPDEHVNEG